MKSAILYGPGDVRIEEVGLPEIGQNDVLVRVDTALTCGTDVKVFARGGHPVMIVPPAPFGHEFSGFVEEAGSSVAGFTKGMRVAAANSAPCMKCFFCRMGRQNLCDDLLFMNGAYSEFIKVPARIVEYNLVRVPDKTGMEAAALLEPVACVLHGIDRTGIDAGDAVAVIGAGPIGLLFIQLLKLRGARVVSVEKEGKRRIMAAGAGADHVLDPVSGSVRDMVLGLTSGRGADAAVDASGSAEAWEEAAGVVRKGGRIALFGGCAPGTSFRLDTELVHYSELAFMGIFHHTPFYVHKAIELISGGGVDAGNIITGRVPLEHLTRALGSMMEGSSAKMAVKPHA